MTKANLKKLDEGKLYYSISEVCTMTGLEQHVLRYWESEIPQLRPKKNRSGNRAYRAKEIKIIRYIKYLLYEEMFTIPGAKKKMADANMADLEGQLTLIRVPATPAPIRETSPAAAGAPQLPNVPADEPANGTAHKAPVVEPVGEIPEGDPRVNASANGAGGEAYAKLREELRRVKQELQDLLAALAASGKGLP